MFSIRFQIFSPTHLSHCIEELIFGNNSIVIKYTVNVSCSCGAEICPEADVNISLSWITPVCDTQQERSVRWRVEMLAAVWSSSPATRVSQLWWKTTGGTHPKLRWEPKHGKIWVGTLYYHKWFIFLVLSHMLHWICLVNVWDLFIVRAEPSNIEYLYLTPCGAFNTWLWHNFSEIIFCVIVQQRVVT